MKQYAIWDVSEKDFVSLDGKKIFESKEELFKALPSADAWNERQLQVVSREVSPWAHESSIFI